MSSAEWASIPQAISNWVKRNCKIIHRQFLFCCRLVSFVSSDAHQKCANWIDSPVQIEFRCLSLCASNLRAHLVGLGWRWVRFNCGFFDLFRVCSVNFDKNECDSLLKTDLCISHTRYILCGHYTMTLGPCERMEFGVICCLLQLWWYFPRIR